MKNLYNELCVPDSIDGFTYTKDYVLVEEVEKFFGEPYMKHYPKEFLSSGTEVYPLSAVFSEILRAGWTYVNTYWRGTRSSVICNHLEGVKVLTFIKQDWEYNK